VFLLFVVAAKFKKSGRRRSRSLPRVPRLPAPYGVKVEQLAGVSSSPSRPTVENDPMLNVLTSAHFVLWIRFARSHSPCRANHGKPYMLFVYYLDTLLAPRWHPLWDKLVARCGRMAHYEGHDSARRAGRVRYVRAEYCQFREQVRNTRAPPQERCLRAPAQHGAGDSSTHQENGGRKLHPGVHPQSR
jgi:hypothetical protein